MDKQKACSKLDKLSNERSLAFGESLNSNQKELANLLKHIAASYYASKNPDNNPDISNKHIKETIDLFLKMASFLKDSCNQYELLLKDKIK